MGASVSASNTRARNCVGVTLDAPGEGPGHLVECQELAAPVALSVGDEHPTLKHGRILERVRRQNVLWTQSFIAVLGVADNVGAFIGSADNVIVAGTLDVEDFVRG
jgi:hypothetical protein